MLSGHQAARIVHGTKLGRANHPIHCSPCIRQRQRDPRSARSPRCSVFLVSSARARGQSTNKLQHRLPAQGPPGEKPILQAQRPHRLGQQPHFLTARACPGAAKQPQTAVVLAPSRWAAGKGMAREQAAKGKLTPPFARPTKKPRRDNGGPVGRGRNSPSKSFQATNIRPRRGAQRSPGSGAVAGPPAPGAWASDTISALVID